MIPLENCLFFCEEIVEDQFVVKAQCLGDLLHWFNARTHGDLSPLVERFSGPSGES